MTWIVLKVPLNRHQPTITNYKSCINWSQDLIEKKKKKIFTSPLQGSSSPFAML